jgi:hypothetical protein
VTGTAKPPHVSSHLVVTLLTSQLTWEPADDIAVMTGSLYFWRSDMEC